ncbi:unnamed protein product [Rangifer tarandus platyrhynchus]|uniref:Uncharacterized protein n=1 Tax=Rangifer tarandus platyrhynchus TaxID=3082113 RepID=A0AC60A4D2_RANTA
MGGGTPRVCDKCPRIWERGGLTPKNSEVFAFCAPRGPDIRPEAGSGPSRSKKRKPSTRQGCQEVAGSYLGVLTGLNPPLGGIERPHNRDVYQAEGPEGRSSSKPQLRRGPAPVRRGHALATPP